jgi:hypothetical protein
MKLDKDLSIRSIKLLDIGYITVIYFIIGIAMVKLCDIFFGKYDEEREKKKSSLRRGLECIAIMWLFGIVIYLVRNITELIPSPFDGIRGFDHMRVKELKDATIFTFVFLHFQEFFSEKFKSYYQLIV